MEHQDDKGVQQRDSTSNPGSTRLPTPPSQRGLVARDSRTAAGKSRYRGFAFYVQNCTGHSACFGRFPFASRTRTRRSLDCLAWSEHLAAALLKVKVSCEIRSRTRVLRAGSWAASSPKCRPGCVSAAGSPSTPKLVVSSPSTSISSSSSVSSSSESLSAEPERRGGGGSSSSPSDGASSTSSTSLKSACRALLSRSARTLLTCSALPRRV